MKIPLAFFSLLATASTLHTALPKPPGWLLVASGVLTVMAWQRRQQRWRRGGR